MRQQQAIAGSFVPPSLEAGADARDLGRRRARRDVRDVSRGGQDGDAEAVPVVRVHPQAGVRASGGPADQGSDPRYPAVAPRAAHQGGGRGDQAHGCFPAAAGGVLHVRPVRVPRGADLVQERRRGAEARVVRGVPVERTVGGEPGEDALSQLPADHASGVPWERSRRSSTPEQDRHLTQRPDRSDQAG